MRSDLEKYEALKRHLSGLGRAAVAFSGGVDSSFLLKVCRDVMGGDVVAFTADSPFFSKRERDFSACFCKKLGIRQIVIRINPLEIEEVRKNVPERCYFCKKMIFRSFAGAAGGLGITHILEGGNADDTGDFRPGMRAVRELGIGSPLLEFGFTKAEIRALSRELGLETWDKPSFACTASRFQYGDTITADDLQLIEKAEDFLADLGFSQRRVRLMRSQGLKSARIEVGEPDLDRILSRRGEISETLAGLGFDFVSLDLKPFRSGNMNRFKHE